MLLLVDACNVLHVEGALPRDLAGVDLRGLAELVARSRYRHDETVLVMDGPTAGPPLPAGPSNIRSIASGPGRTADEVIVGLLETSTSPRSVIVVSSDRAIRRRARRRRCRMVHSETFLEQIGRDASASGRRGDRDSAPPEASTARWLKEFGLDERSIAELVRPSEPDDVRPSAPTVEADETDPPPPAEVEPPPTRRRVLGEAKSLDDVDPQELERFDMGEWIDPPSTTNNEHPPS